jgi:hypothetical protein
MNKVVVIKLLMNSCSNVVVVMTYVVVELMHWVSRIGELVMEVVVVVESCESLVNW